MAKVGGGGARSRRSSMSIGPLGLGLASDRVASRRCSAAERIQIAA